MNPATLSDVEDRYYRPLTDRELINAWMWLDDAWWFLTTRLPDLEADITAANVAAETARNVVVAMVMRMLKNPDGLVSESIDDYSYRRATNAASGVMSVSPEEIALLTPGGRSRFVSRRTVAYGDFT
jgi:hypothetical protein